MTSYKITFCKDVDIPDLAKNDKLKEYFRIQSQQEDGYLVSSKINDVNLRQLIMDEYGLTKKDLLIANMHFQPFSNLY